MPAATMAWVIPGILGAAGLVQASDAQRRQKNASDEARSLAERGIQINEQVTQEKLDSMRRLRGHVEGYNYDADTKTAIDRANEVADHQLGKTLSKYDSDWLGQGGAPGQSSEYYVRKAGATRGVMDPLRELAAQRALGKHQAQINDELAIQGVPTGQLANNYFNGSQMLAGLGGGGGDFGPGIKALIQAIGGIPGPSKGNQKANAAAGANQDGASDTGGTRWWNS